MSLRTHMQDLKDYTQDVHYENFRKKKLLEGSPAAKYYYELLVSSVCS